jgi:SHS2 domain-containing protein
MNTRSVDRGHVSVAHTGDEIIEAWGPTREVCLEEAANGLVASFAIVDRARWGWHRQIELAGSDEELLITLLEDIIYHLDTDNGVPVRVQVHRLHGRLVADLWLTDLHQVTGAGAAPKGIAYSQLVFGPVTPERWACSFTVDV